MVEDGLIGHDGSPVGVLSLELLGWLVEEQPELAQPQTPPGTLGSGARVCLPEGMSISWGCQVLPQPGCLSRWVVALVVQGGSSRPFSVSIF